jgi:hypothetical protein
LVVLADLIAPFLKEKGAHAALSNAAWQEIRVRSGRDDKFVFGKLWFFQSMHSVT